jgi:hypothetical protein
MREDARHTSAAARRIVTRRQDMRFVAALICVAAVSGSLLAQAPATRRDGNWQVTMEINIPGMPQSMPPMTMNQCITKEQANDPSKLLPQGGGRGMPPECKVSDMKTEGNKTSWSMKCEGQMPMSGTGEFTFNGDTYTGLMKIDTDRGGQPMTMTMKYAGKRLGDCTQ